MLVEPDVCSEDISVEIEIYQYISLNMHLSLGTHTTGHGGTQTDLHLKLTISVPCKYSAALDFCTEISFEVHIHDFDSSKRSTNKIS